MKEKPSKFAALLKSRQEEAAPEPTVAAEAKPTPQRVIAKPKPSASVRPKAKPEPALKTLGRPAGQGKKGHPDFTQITAYIPVALHTETKINLLRLPDKKEFSELLAELLTVWNKKPR